LTFISSTSRLLASACRLAGLASLMLMVWNAPSAAVYVEGDDQSNIVLSTEDESLPSVLAALGEKFGVEIEGVEHTEKGDPLNGRMSGSLKSVLSRLLKNWNHVIVSPKDDPGAVQKVMILNSTFGAAAPASKSDAKPAVDESGIIVP
jgi:hypothetical protein